MHAGIDTMRSRRKKRRFVSPWTDAISFFSRTDQRSETAKKHTNPSLTNTHSTQTHTVLISTQDLFHVSTKKMSTCSSKDFRIRQKKKT